MCGVSKTVCPLPRRLIGISPSLLLRLLPAEEDPRLRGGPHAVRRRQLRAHGHGEVEHRIAYGREHAEACASDSGKWAGVRRLRGEKGEHGQRNASLRAHDHESGTPRRRRRAAPDQRPTAPSHCARALRLAETSISTAAQRRSRSCTPSASSSACRTRALRPMKATTPRTGRAGAPGASARADGAIGARSRSRRSSPRGRRRHPCAPKC